MTLIWPDNCFDHRGNGGISQEQVLTKRFGRLEFGRRQNENDGFISHREFMGTLSNNKAGTLATTEAVSLIKRIKATELGRRKTESRNVGNFRLTARRHHVCIL